MNAGAGFAKGSVCCSEFSGALYPRIRCCKFQLLLQSSTTLTATPATHASHVQNTQWPIHCEPADSLPFGKAT